MKLVYGIRCSEYSWQGLFIGIIKSHVWHGRKPCTTFYFTVLFVWLYEEYVVDVVDILAIFIKIVQHHFMYNIKCRLMNIQMNIHISFVTEILCWILQIKSITMVQLALNCWLWTFFDTYAIRIRLLGDLSETPLHLYFIRQAYEWLKSW